MKGYQITFYTLHNRRHHGRQMHEWLMQAAKDQGIRGSTAIEAVEGYDHAGQRHSVHFFSLTDQPMEITMAMTEAQATLFFQLLEKEEVNLFYVKTAVEFGTVGALEEPDADSATVKRKR